MKKILPLAILTALLFSSCDGFLSGAQTKEQLDRIIEYNNAQTYTISVNSDKGSGVIKSPAGGEAQKKVTDTFTLAFEASADYEFITWKIIDSVTKKEYPNGEYLTIGSLDQDSTTCTLLKEPQEGIKLCLYAVVAKRPRVISSTPLWDAAGAYRDARIQVMFDHDMNENSIYFDPVKEIPELKAEYELKDSDFISLKNDTTKIYAYTKDNTIYYKNISINNYVSGRSLLEYFDEPSFEDPRTLIIPTKTDKDPPAAGTQILVTLNKNFSYSYAKEKNVSLKEDNIWVYYVNTKTDTVPPEFSGNLVLKNADNPVITDSTDLSQDPSSSTLLHNSSINIDIKIFDGDSGPNGYFILKIDGKDASGNFKDNHSVTIPYENVDSMNAEYKNSFKFPDYLPDGDYKITGITISDKNGRTKDSDALNYYITIDSTPPEISSFNVGYDTLGQNNYKSFVYTFRTSDTDLDYVNIKMRDKGSEESWTSITETKYTDISNKQIELRNYEKGKTYEFWAEFFDKAGNSCTITSTKGFVTYPKNLAYASVNVEFPVEDSKGARITWANPGGNYSGIYVKGDFLLNGREISEYTFLDENEACECITPEIILTGNKGRNLQIYNLYRYEGVDYKSQEAVSKGLKAPAISNTYRTQNSIKVINIKRDGSDYRVSYKAEAEAEYHSPVNISNEDDSYEITGLVPGSKYFVYVEELEHNTSNVIFDYELSGFTKVDLPKNLKVVTKTYTAQIQGPNGQITVNKPELSLSWTPPEGNFDNYRMAIYRWQSNNTFESTSAQTNFIVIDKDQTSYETKTIKIGVDPVELKFCSAYRILLSVKGGNQGYSDDTSQEFYVCTIPDYSFTATRIKTGAITSIEVNCTVAGSSTYVYSSGNYDNVADLYVYWAKTEEAVKSATNTNFIELGTNVTARSYSHSFTASSLSGFKPSCYFAVKAVLKIDNNNKPGVYTTCEESWSEVKSFSLN